MTPTLGLLDETYLPALREILDVHEDLSRHHRSLSDAMRMLRHGGWSGPAAAEYFEGWSDWEDGCDQVLNALMVMTEVMLSVSLGLHQCDQQQSLSVAALGSQLGDPVPGRLVGQLAHRMGGTA